jgi:hypothetical protein
MPEISSTMILSAIYLVVVVLGYMVIRKDRRKK